MKYIDEINAFERWLESNHLHPLSQLLWYKLFKLNNRAGWGSWVQIENLRLMAEIQVRREATFIGYRDDLLDKKLVEYKKGRKGCPNKYRIKSLCGTCTFTGEVQSVVDTVVQPVVQSVVQSVVHTADISRLDKDKSKIKEPPISPKGKLQDVLEERFNSFWTAYPKKVGKGKAEEWFNKKKPSTKLLGDMLAAISVQHHTEQWQKDGGQYIPNPTTWLNQERWRDTPQGLSKAPVEAKSKDVFHYMNGGK